MKICRYRNYDLSLSLLCSASGMNTTKTECLKSQVERVFFSTGWPSWLERQFHGIYRRKNCGVYVQTQIQPDTYIRTKTLVATVEFQLHPLFPPQPHLPSFCTPPQPL